MQIFAFQLGPLGTNAYLILPPDREDAVLIDAPFSAHEVFQEALTEHKRTLAALLLTHGHWDHIADVAAFNQAGVPVYAHPADRAWIENPQVQAGFMVPGLKILPGKIDHLINHGDTLKLAGLNFEVRHVPGHAPGSVLFYLAELGLAFVGDTVMAGGVGRTDLPGGNAADLKKSIRGQIYTLPDETALYSGHGPGTTVGVERKTNPHVKG